MRCSERHFLEDASQEVIDVLVPRPKRVLCRSVSACVKSYFTFYENCHHQTNSFQYLGDFFLGYKEITLRAEIFHNVTKNESGDMRDIC